MSKTLKDLEKDKFDVDDEGNTIVRTSAKGVFKFSGLNTGGKVTAVVLNDSTWSALPTTALSNRNAISIQNRSGHEIKLNYDNSVVGYVGMTISNGEERQYDITDAIVIYAKAISGTTPTIMVEEIA